MLSQQFLRNTLRTQTISPFSLSLLQANPFSATLTPVRFRFQYLRNRSRVKRDILRHKAVSELEIPRMVFKAIHRDQRLDLKTRLQAMMTLQNMHSYTHPTALKPRCVETGRANGLIRGFGVSRIVFREAAINGKLSGIVRAVW